MVDLISREALMKFPIRMTHYDRINGSEKYVFGVEAVLEYAQNLPTVDAVEVVRHAKWEEYPDRAHIKCTGCRVEFKKEKMPMSRAFCPNCGAKMDGGADG